MSLSQIIETMEGLYRNGKMVFEKLVSNKINKCWKKITLIRDTINLQYINNYKYHFYV